MAEKKAYTQAFNTGKYEKSSGLLGKYDNVRRFWEDQVTGIFLRPALNSLIEYKRKRMERIRILDLGCGSGDGYDLLMGVMTKDPGIYDYLTSAITEDMLQEYVGLDINADLLKQAEEYYGNQPKMRFIKSDLSNGFENDLKKERPFDIYFSSYGTYSHFTNDQAVKIISDICQHAGKRAIFVTDWLGRYSYEWQDLWHAPEGSEYFMDYKISYIYPEEERHEIEIPSFPLRLMNQNEIMTIINRASEMSKTEILPIGFYDRSIFIGRHLETGDYNIRCPKLRTAVNSLFEGYLRTDLTTLLTDYVRRPHFDRLNDFFEMYFMCCNTLVEYTIMLLNEFNTNGKIPDDTNSKMISPDYPGALKEAMKTMHRVIEGVGWIEWGDVRANVIEPHLGYSLRKLEMDLQPRIGAGHSLIGIFEIQK